MVIRELPSSPVPDPVQIVPNDIMPDLIPADVTPAMLLDATDPNDPMARCPSPDQLPRPAFPRMPPGTPDAWVPGSSSSHAVDLAGTSHSNGLVGPTQADDHADPESATINDSLD